MSDQAPFHKLSSSRAEAAPALARWLPGLATLREYRLSWLPHDIVAGLVLTTMLVPVGIAYAVASGVPGSTGCTPPSSRCSPTPLFGPSRILVLGPDSSLAAVILAVVLPLSGGDPDARRGPGGHDGGGVGAGVHPGRRAAPGLRHRAAVQADPLRLHERHRAHRADQPAAQAVRLFDREPTGRCATCWAIGEAILGGKANWTALRGRRRHAGGDPAAQALQANPRPPDRGVGATVVVGVLGLASAPA